MEPNSHCQEEEKEKPKLESLWGEYNNVIRNWKP